MDKAPIPFSKSLLLLPPRTPPAKQKSQVSSGREFVPNAVDGQDVFRFFAVVAEFFSQLNDDLVESAGGSVVAVAPDLVQQAVAREDFARMRVEDLQQLQFFGGEFLDRFAPFELKCFRINGRRAD